MIVDEAYRSIYRMQGAIFAWCDSLLVGLTAAPQDEIDRNTYSLFQMGNPCADRRYQVADTVKDGYLAPMKAVSVPLKSQREGIRYDELPEDEQEA